MLQKAVVRTKLSPPLPPASAEVIAVSPLSQVQITDGTNTVAVGNAAPVGTEYGLIVRNIPIDMPTEPGEYNITLTLADTEYSQALPDGTKKIQFMNRTSTSSTRFAFTTGKVATPTEPYFTLPTGADYFELNVFTDGVTIYFASSNAGDVIELLTWN